MKIIINILIKNLFKLGKIAQFIFKNFKGLFVYLK